MGRLSCIDLTEAEQTGLLRIARESIAHGLIAGRPLAVQRSECAGALGRQIGSFVTLLMDERLRGCVGRIESAAPLAEGVATAAFNAAFHDPRFPGLTANELDRILIEISVLSEPQAMPVESEAALVENLQPHIDGLILVEGKLQATFLPRVWEKLPDPARFVRALKIKAGLTENQWSGTIRCYRYRTIAVADQKTPTAALS